MSGDLKKAIREQCRKMEIPLVGVAAINRWRKPLLQPWIPKDFFPDSIVPETKSVIVIGLPMHLPVVETAPSIYYRELYTTVNHLLDQYTYRLANYLNDRGFPSVFVPRDGYGSIKVLLKKPVAFFSHRHAAYLAGLGTFGVNNMILTPDYGPRVRFGSVFTAAKLSSDPILTEHLCIRCMRCVRQCPSRALQPEEYPKGMTEKLACASRSAELNERYISPCGICIKVCPAGKDREFYQREDLSPYEDRESNLKLRQAWDHVQQYGGLERIP